MTASFHRFGEFFPGTGDVRVCPPSVIVDLQADKVGCGYEEG